MSINKPFSAAADRNKDVILQRLLHWFADVPSVLEIGSGTGQHATYFAARLPHLQWHCSDRIQSHPGIVQWMQDTAYDNINGPWEFDVTGEWPLKGVHSVFSANTAHIMPWTAVCALFNHVKESLPARGKLVLYGPFNRKGEFTSDGNRAFDKQLRMKDPQMGIRDDVALFTLASNSGLTLLADEDMPSNNRLLIWQKQA